MNWKRVVAVAWWWLVMTSVLSLFGVAITGTVGSGMAFAVALEAVVAFSVITIEWMT